MFIRIFNTLRELNWLAITSILFLGAALALAVWAVSAIQVTAFAIVVGLIGVALALFSMV